ncbi:MAG: glycosyltransferase family 2 protein [Bacteroidota bacterium]
MGTPILSIGIISYNQAEFIEKAINSVMAQQTQYPFELIICDDASEDNTDDIVNGLLRGVSFSTQYVRNKTRKGPLLNGKNFIKHASGKYLCWMDADDYWCYENKIQKQIDFLESNLDYNGCFHDAKIISDIEINEDLSEQLKEQTHGRWKSYSQFNTYQSDFYPWDVLQRKIIPTASLMIRNRDLNHFLEKHLDVNLSVSWALHLELIKNSKFKYFNELWSVYFDHAKGFSKSIDLVTFKLNNIQILFKLLDDAYYSALKKDVYRAIANEYYFLLHSAEAQKRSTKEYRDYCKAYTKWADKATKEDVERFKTTHKLKNQQ